MFINVSSLSSLHSHYGNYFSCIAFGFGRDAFSKGPSRLNLTLTKRRREKKGKSVRKSKYVDVDECEYGME